MVKLYNGINLDAVRYRINDDARNITNGLGLLEYLLDTVPDLLVALEVMGDQLELARKTLADDMLFDEDGVVNGMCRYCSTILFKPSDHADDCVLRRVFAIQPDGNPTVTT